MLKFQSWNSKMSHGKIIDSANHTQTHDPLTKRELGEAPEFNSIVSSPRLWGIAISGQKYKLMDWGIAAGARWEGGGKVRSRP